MRNSWLPELITFPCFITKILFALWMVDSLWAITKVVLFLVRLFIAFWTISSDPASSDEVASSRRIMEDFFKIALAIDILCFCPPESRTPFSPTLVSNLWGRLLMKSVAAALSQAFIISSFVAPGFA